MPLTVTVLRARVAGDDERLILAFDRDGIPVSRFALHFDEFSAVVAELGHAHGVLVERLAFERALAREESAR